jgi:hypothetical protein
MPGRPKFVVEWALFCDHAERDGLGFLNLTRLKRTVPRVPGENVGIPMFLVFGVSGEPNTKATLHITIVWPNDHKVSHSIPLELRSTGYIDVNADMTPLVVNQIGELRAEFRFGNDSSPCYVAALRIVDAEFSILPGIRPNAAKTH